MFSHINQYEAKNGYKQAILRSILGTWPHDGPEPAGRGAAAQQQLSVWYHAITKNGMTPIDRDVQRIGRFLSRTGGRLPRGEAHLFFGSHDLSIWGL